ncbi:unnamed protein product [Spodoptera exigua]|nr:unnamed protein product [Spodoptera exigua]
MINLFITQLKLSISILINPGIGVTQYTVHKSDSANEQTDYLMVKMSVVEGGGPEAPALTAPATTPTTPPPSAITADATGQLIQVPVAPRKPPRRGPKVQQERPKRALFCLTLKNPMRKAFIDIVEWKYPLQND